MVDLIKGTASQIMPNIGAADTGLDLSAGVDFFEGLVDRFNQIKMLDAYGKARLEASNNILKIQQEAIASGDFSNVLNDSEDALANSIDKIPVSATQLDMVAEWRARDIGYLREKTQAFVLTQTVAQGAQQARESLRALETRAMTSPADVSEILVEAESYRKPLENLTQNIEATDQLITSSKDTIGYAAITAQAAIDPASAQLLLDANIDKITAKQAISLKNIIANQFQTLQKQQRIELENNERIANLKETLDRNITVDFTNPDNKKAMELIFQQSVQDEKEFQALWGAGVQIEDVIIDAGILPSSYLGILKSNIIASDNPSSAIEASKRLMYMYNGSLAVRNQLNSENELVAMASSISTTSAVDLSSDQEMTKETLRNLRVGLTPEAKKIRENEISSHLSKAQNQREFLNLAGTPELLSLPSKNTLGEMVFGTAYNAEDIVYVDPNIINSWNEILHTNVVYGNSTVEQGQKVANAAIGARSGITEFGTDLWGGFAVVPYPIEKITNNHAKPIMENLREATKDLDPAMQTVSLSRVSLTPIPNLVGKYHVSYIEEDYGLLNQVLNEDGSLFVFDAFSVPKQEVDSVSLLENIERVMKILPNKLSPNREI